LAQKVTDGSGRSTVVLTFLIADVRGYTRFTRERGDAAAAVLAKRFADLARDAVEARGGRVIELRGDEALAVFESAPQAVRAAVEFQATCAEESEADPAFPLPVGIGIASGEAVPVEDGYRGVALNMAARLCSNAAAGQVLVTQAIVQATQAMDGEIGFVERGPASFKGFEQAVDLIEAVVVRSAPTGLVPPEPRPDGGMPPELDPLTLLVDREHEMRWLRGTWRQVRRGHGRVLFVSGPAQIGKTRLAGEIASHVHAGGDVVRYAGPGGAATAIALSAIRETARSSSPMLLVLDDVDIAGPPVAQALLSSYEELSGRPVLVLVLVRDHAAGPDLSAVIDRADERGDGHRALAPFDLDGVRGIVRLYVGDGEADAPVESMARASRGVPGRIHEVVSDWARSEARRRLAAAAEFLAAGRDRRASDLEFANNVIGLKLGRLYSVEGRDFPPVEACPYKGLAQFEAEDSAYFFGRERFVGELAARTVQVGLLGVVGASGSGKSSVIAAGLLPSLRAGLLPGSEQWEQASIRPGEHPMDELRAAFGTEVEDPLAEAIEAMPPDRRLVLVVDQFEETFTICPTEEERAAFIDALVGTATRWPERLVVILAIRGDYYAHGAPYPELAEALAANHVLVGPLTREELRRAIELPARRAGLRVESGLVDALVEEVADEPGGLPLLSTALVELWQARDGGWIRLEAFERTGGVRGAVSRFAESSFDHLSDAEHEAARGVFLRLVAGGDGETVTRRRVSLEEFDLDRDVPAAAVIARLTRDRLLTMSDGTVEMAHEALLREWPRLQEWLEEDAQGRQLRHHLTEASRQWQAGGREPSELYRGARLSASLDWSAGHGADLNELEREFLTASRQAGEQEAERQRRTNRRLRGLLAGVAVFLVLALLGGGLALVQRGSARRSARAAERSAAVALSQSLGAQAVSEPRLDVAMLLAREAVDLDSSFRTRSDLLTTLLRVPTVLRTLHGTTHRLNGMALSWDGRTLALADNAGRILVEDTSTGRLIHSMRTSSSSLAFGPDGSLLELRAGKKHQLGVDATDPVTGTVRRTLWLSPSMRTRTVAGGGNFTSFVFDRSGARLAVAFQTSVDDSSPPLVAQFDYGSGKVTGSFSSDVLPVAYTPDRRRLVMVGPSNTEVFDSRTGRRVRSYPVGGSNGALSPDGRTLAIGRGDGSVRFLDLATGRAAVGVGAHQGPVDGIGFTPDSATLISSGEDGKSFLWDVASHTIRQTLAGHAARIHDQAISADGSTLYTGSFDTNILAWDLTGERGLATSFQAANSDPAFEAWNVAVSPDGQTLAVGGTDGTVNLWDLESQQKKQSFQAGPGLVAALSFAPDGRSLLVAGDSVEDPNGAFLRIWRLGTPPTLLQDLHGLSHITWAAFSPDGTKVAASGRTAQREEGIYGGGEVAEWDATTGKLLSRPTTIEAGGPVDVAFAPQDPPVAIGGANGVVAIVDPAQEKVLRQFSTDAEFTMGVAYSPDGTKLATADFDGFLRLWDPATGTALRAPLALSQNPLNSVNWSPNGRTIVTVDWAGAVRLTDVATGRDLGPPFQIGENRFPYALFTPDGNDVVVTDDSGRVWIFPAAVEAWADHACVVANRSFTRAEWREFFPGRPYYEVCPAASGG